MSEKTGLETRTSRWMLAGIVLTVLAVLAFPLYRINEPAARADAAEAAQANLARSGADIWASSCASCHGVTGEGVDAPALNSLQFLTIVSDEQIASIISTGMPGTDMAAYAQQFDGPLTREQIAGVVACVRSWEEDAPDRPDWRDMLNVVEEEGDGHGHGEEAEDDHGDEAGEEGPAPCGPDYDAANFIDDHAEDEPADAHDDDEPADAHADDGHEEDGDADADGHDEDTAEHADDAPTTQEAVPADHVDDPDAPPHDDPPAEDEPADHVDPPGTPDHDD